MSQSTHRELTDEQATAFRDRSDRRLGKGLRNLNLVSARGYIERADQRGDPKDTYYEHCQRLIERIEEEIRQESE